MRAPLLVGLLLIGSAATLSWFVVSTSKDKFDEDNTILLHADFSDASGIRWKTRVQINGIDIGKIEKIVHVRDPKTGRLIARVTIRILDEYVVYANAKIRKAPESLLGDFRLDLDPGAPVDMCSRVQPCAEGFTCEEGLCLHTCLDEKECATGMTCVSGRCEHPQLKNGELIQRVQSVSDLEAIQAELKEVAENVNEVTRSVSQAIAGPEGEGSMKSILEKVEESMEAIQTATATLSGTLDRNDERLDRILANVDDFTEAMAQTTGAAGYVTRSGENIAKITERLDGLAASLQGMVEGEYAGDTSLRQTLDQLNQSIAHLNAITGKVDAGQGTLGRVVNDAGIADRIEQTLDDTSEFIGSLSRLETQIELRSQYEVPFGPENTEVQGIKNTLALRIVPKPDKYYVLEAVADPRGVQRNTVTTTSEDEDAPTTTTTTITSFDDMKFSAMFAKRYYFLTLRFGIIESTGGLGLNFHLLDDDLELRLDAFDFNRKSETQTIFPRLRTTAMFELVNHLALQGGVDDPFNSKLRTWFLGGALRFNDDDLKALLTIAPSP